MGRAVWFAALTALALRLGALAFLGDPLGLGSAAQEWDWGYEQAAVGRALARGDGFADAFGKGSGPTGWATPVYPSLFALLSLVCGGVGPCMAWTLAVLQSAFSALTCLALARLARGLGRAELSAAVAWTWALYPPAIWFAVTLVWDSTLVALGVVWWLGWLACAGREASPARVAWIGAGLGLVLLVNPAPIALVPAAIAWYRFRPRAALALVGGLLLVVGPWMLRNQISVGNGGLRTNLGVELMVGNNDLAEGQWVSQVHPAYNPVEYARYVELGEAEYARQARGTALTWIGDHPARFAVLCAVRLRRFWIGRGPLEETRDWMGWIEWVVGVTSGVLALSALWLWRGAPGSGWLVRGALLLFPVVYGLTHVLPRYRFPLDGVVVMACVAVVWDGWIRLRTRHAHG
jgi:hypothetical protein